VSLLTAPTGRQPATWRSRVTAYPCPLLIISTRKRLGNRARTAACKGRASDVGTVCRDQRQRAGQYRDQPAFRTWYCPGQRSRDSRPGSHRCLRSASRMSSKIPVGAGRYQRTREARCSSIRDDRSLRTPWPSITSRRMGRRCRLLERRLRRCCVLNPMYWPWRRSHRKARHVRPVRDANRARTSGD